MNHVPTDTTSSASARRILLIEPDARLRRRQVRLLRREGYAVDAFDAIEPAWSALHWAPYDMLVIDRFVRDISGAVFEYRLSNSGLTLPVIVTAGGISVEILNPAPQPAPWFDLVRRQPPTFWSLPKIIGFVFTCMAGQRVGAHVSGQQVPCPL